MEIRMIQLTAFYAREDLDIKTRPFKENEDTRDGQQSVHRLDKEQVQARMIWRNKFALL